MAELANLIKPCPLLLCYRINLQFVIKRVLQNSIYNKQPFFLQKQHRTCKKEFKSVVGVEETIARNTSMAASSIHFESASSHLDQIFTSQRRSHSHVSLFYAIRISNIQHKDNVVIMI